MKDFKEKPENDKFTDLISENILIDFLTNLSFY